VRGQDDSDEEVIEEPGNLRFIGGYLIAVAAILLIAILTLPACRRGPAPIAGGALHLTQAQGTLSFPPPDFYTTDGSVPAVVANTAVLEGHARSSTVPGNKGEAASKSKAKGTLSHHKHKAKKSTSPPIPPR